MATYATTSWQEDDEIYYQTLQQMSDNDTWLKENATFGTITYYNAGPVTNTSGAVVDNPWHPAQTGIVAPKMYAISLPFDSMSVQPAHHVWVYWPTAFTKIPVVTVTITAYGDVSPHAQCRIVEQGTERIIVNVHDTLMNSNRFKGVLNVIAVGV